MKKKNVIFDLETTSIEPYLPESRITMIGLGCDGKYYGITDPDERVMLRKFARYLRGLKEYRIISYNGNSFDVPYLFSRIIFHNLKFPNIIDKHLDLRRFLNLGNGFKKGTLNDFGQLISMKKIENTDGKTAIKLWNENRISELKKYCLQDIRITEGLLSRIIEIGWL